ncbi:MAG: hypothetical protein ACYC5G_03985 [Candidatus Doudnabacteria bacterium]
MKYISFFLILFLFSCKTKQAVIVFTNMRDSTKIELIATPRVVNKLIKENERTERLIASSIKRSLIVDARNGTKQASIDAKKDVKIAKSNNAVAKNENRANKAVAKKEIQSVIVAKKRLPNSLKWGAVLLLSIIFGWLVIKKKIPFLR